MDAKSIKKIMLNIFSIFFLLTSCNNVEEAKTVDCSQRRFIEEVYREVKGFVKKENLKKGMNASEIFYLIGKPTGGILEEGTPPVSSIFYSKEYIWELKTLNNKNEFEFLKLTIIFNIRSEEVFEGNIYASQPFLPPSFKPNKKSMKKWKVLSFKYSKKS